MLVAAAIIVAVNKEVLRILEIVNLGKSTAIFSINAPPLKYLAHLSFLSLASASATAQGDVSK